MQALVPMDVYGSGKLRPEKEEINAYVASPQREKDVALPERNEMMSMCFSGAPRKERVNGIRLSERGANIGVKHQHSMGYSCHVCLGFTFTLVLLPISVEVSEPSKPGDGCI